MLKEKLNDHVMAIFIAVWYFLIWTFIAILIDIIDDVTIGYCNLLDLLPPVLLPALTV